mgnify:CR=1 FL=1
MFIKFPIIETIDLMRFFLLMCGLSGVIPLVQAQLPPMNPAEVVGVESCAECHEEMVDAWEGSAHSKSFETLLSGPKAQEMASILQVRPGEIPATASCVRCHYTQELIASIPQPTAGISCESCHGAAFDWIDEHYRKSLSRDRRVSSSVELGMIHPDSVSAMTKTCYECHVIDDEQLVNLAGHPAVSEQFEFLSWYSGEVTHNFLVQVAGKSVKSHSDVLQPISANRQRMLFLTGKLQHLSFSLRALARAKDPPVDLKGNFIRLPDGSYTYGVQHAMVIRNLQKDFKEIVNCVPIPQFSRALALLRGLELKTGYEREMVEVADQLDRLIEQFCSEGSGSSFGAIDPLMKRNKPKYSGE